MVLIGYEKIKLNAYRHKLARIKGMDRVVVPRDVTFDTFVICYCLEGYRLLGVCSCGKRLVQYKHNYCPDCGRLILWNKCYEHTNKLCNKPYLYRRFMEVY